MSNAWGVSFGVSWGVSWGSGAPSPAPSPNAGGGYFRETAYQKYKEDEYQRLLLEEKREELARLDNEISQAEEQKLAAHKGAQEKLEEEKAAKKLAALEAALQDEINRLRIERVWLMRLIDDEEAILTLLMSLPFH